jgi:hypothetical protein
MSQLYLILHKVRGQPALDCAERCDDMGTPSDPAPWWIIPTSGHRAYPFKTYTMEEAGNAMLDPIPDSWPDHYSNRKEATPQPTRNKSSIDDLMF